MKNDIKEALRIIRAAGHRIPRSFAKRLTTKSGFTPTREDNRAFKEAVSKLSAGDRLVMGISNKGKLIFNTYDAYQNQLKTAAHARKFNKKHTPEAEAVA